MRIAVMECGSSWLESLLKRFGHVYHKMPQAFAGDPVASFRRHVFIAPFYEEPVAKVVELMGANRVLFGSDWPHPERLARPLDFLNDIAGLRPTRG